MRSKFHLGIPVGYSHFIWETDLKGAPKKTKLKE